MERIEGPVPDTVVVKKGFPLVFGFFSERLQITRSIEGIVGMTLLHQLEGIFPVNRFAFALTVGGIRMTRRGFGCGCAVGEHPFVRDYAAPVQCFYDVLFSSGDIPLGIGVFNAQHKCPVVFFCKKIIEKCGANSAHMKRPRGAWGKSHPDILCLHVNLVFGVCMRYPNSVFAGRSFLPSCWLPAL